MTDEQKQQWQRALTAKAKRQRTNRGRRKRTQYDVQGVRWMPPAPTHVRHQKRGYQ